MFEDKHQEGYRFVELDHFTIDERMDHWPLSAVAENLGEEHGVVFVNINDLVVQGIIELPGIFKPAQAGDLKRSALGRFPTGC